MSFGYQILGFGAFPSRGVGAYVPTHAAVFDGSADYLVWKNPTIGSRTNFTISWWMKTVNGLLGSTSYLFSAGDGTGNEEFAVAWLDTEILRIFSVSSGSTYQNFDYRTSQVFRDTTAWQHCVISFDGSNGTAGDRIRLWINGSEVADADFGTSTDPVQGELSYWTDDEPHNIGRTVQGSNYAPIYLAEFISLDGVSVTDASKFGETDSSTGIWVAKDPLQGYTGGAAGDPNIADWGGVNSLYFNFSDTYNLGKNFRPIAVTANDGSYKIDYSIYFDASNDYLEFTPSGAGNLKTYTLSFWAKVSDKNTSNGYILDAGAAGATSEGIRFTGASSTPLYVTGIEGDGYGFATTTALYRDPTAWMHVVYVKNTADGTASDRVKIFVNGVRITDFSATRTVPLNEAGGAVNTTVAHRIGGNAYNATPAQFYGGYLAEYIFLDGYAGSASDFGGWDANGIWMPVDPTTIVASNKGTNGVLLQFKGDGGTFDSNADAGGVGADTSGNNNHYTGNGSVHDNRTTDTPTNTSGDNEGNYPVFNPLSKNSSVTLSNGNLTHTGTDGDIDTNTKVTIPLPDTGKFYFEFTAGSSSGVYIGVAVGSCANNESGNAANKGFLYQQNGKFYAQPITASSGDTYGSTWTTNDVIGVAIDMTNGGDMWFAKNNTWQSSATASEIAAGTTTNAAVTNMPTNTTNSRTYDGSGLFVAVGDSSASGTGTINFGQKAFSYTPPTGFGRLSAATLPAPTYIDARKYFAPVLWEGTGSARLARGCFDSTGTAWTPDWVWIKGRNDASDHALFDSVRDRGTRAVRTSNSTAQDTDSTAVLQFISGGVRLGDSSGGSNAVNRDHSTGYTYVGWFWKAGGMPTVDNAVGVSDGASMTSGSVFKGDTAITFTPHNDATVLPKRMSIADHGGFSIVSYVGSGSDNLKYPHGLDRAPDMIMNKCTSDASTNWVVYHSGINYATNTSSAITAKEGYLSMNSASGAIDDATQWSDEDPTAELVTLGSGGAINGSANEMISYCFARVPGLIGIGSYTGNGSTDGPMVIVDDGASGFRPAWLMIKSVGAAGNWNIVDAARDPFNQISDGLRPNANIAEFSGQAMDFIANGFKLRLSGSDYNTSSQSYIYLAFADQEFSLQSRTR